LREIGSEERVGGACVDAGQSMLYEQHARRETKSGSYCRSTSTGYLNEPSGTSVMGERGTVLSGVRMRKAAAT
jgi:hypothetical protein